MEIGLLRGVPEKNQKLIKFDCKRRLAIPKSFCDRMRIDENSIILLVLYPIDEIIEIRKVKVDVDYPSQLDVSIGELITGEKLRKHTPTH